jgi:hypothetical protein
MFTMTAFGQTDDTFRKIYDAYIAALKAKDFEAIVNLSTADQQDWLNHPLNCGTVPTILEKAPPGDVLAYNLAGFFAQSLSHMPNPYEVRFVQLSKDGKKARMVMVGVIPPVEEVQRANKLPAKRKREKDMSPEELYDYYSYTPFQPPRKVRDAVVFAEEAGVWKMGQQTLDGEPEDNARPKDLNMGQRGNYSDEANTDLRWEIQRVEKQAAGTVYVVRVVDKSTPSGVQWSPGLQSFVYTLRVLDEEDAVFVPAAHVSSDFVSSAILSCRAAKHKKDPLKYWAESVELVDEFK